MIKNSIKMIAFVAILVASSCKNKEEFATVMIDENNKVVPQNLSGDTFGMQESLEKQNKNKIKNYPKLEIVGGEIFDFGTIKEGEIVNHVFKVKNTGKTDLVIMNAQASCGCTIPDWTKRPILPGEVGEIKFSFNSANKPGEQKKSITLSTNTEEGHEVLKFKAFVTPKTK